MQFTSRFENQITLRLDSNEVTNFIADIGILYEVYDNYSDSLIDFIYQNLKKSQRKIGGFEISLANGAIKEFIHTMNTKLAKDYILTRTTWMILNYFEYYIMTDKAKSVVQSRPYSHEVKNK
jgi:hypothetical protein